MDEWIFMKFSGYFGYDTRNNLEHLEMIGLTTWTQGFFFYFPSLSWLKTSRNYGWVDIHEIFRIWTQEAIGVLGNQHASCLSYTLCVLGNQHASCLSYTLCVLGNQHASCLSYTLCVLGNQHASCLSYTLFVLGNQHASCLSYTLYVLGNQHASCLSYTLCVWGTSMQVAFLTPYVFLGNQHASWYCIVCAG